MERPSRKGSRLGAVGSIAGKSDIGNQRLCILWSIRIRSETNVSKPPTLELPTRRHYERHPIYPTPRRASLYWALRGYISLHLSMQDARGSVQASRQSSASHLVLQTVATLLQSSMQWCRTLWVSESCLVSDAAKETAVRISRAGIEIARARYRGVMVLLRFFAPRASVVDVARGLTSSASRIPAGSRGFNFVHAPPINTPAPSTIAPPSTIWNTACRNGVSI